MWDIDNRSDLAALGYFVRSRKGAEHWVTAVRGRFHILPDGMCQLAEDQGAIRIAPEYASEDGTELLVESEICPFRPKTDVVLCGEMTAPEDRTLNKIEVGFDLAGRGKRAMAFGERRLRQYKGKLQLEGYTPFLTRDLSWRYSLGGQDFLEENSGISPDNPIGMGWTEKWQSMPADTEVTLPLIESSHQPIGDGPLPPAMGFGCIHPAWQTRARLAGTYDDDWRRYEAPLLPADFSEGFFQAAPNDQVFDLKGGESGRIIGMSKDGTYDFRLPQIILEASCWMAGDRVESRPRLISVVINGTEKTVEMVWNSVIPCPKGDMAVSNSRVHVRQMAGVEK